MADDTPSTGSEPIDLTKLGKIEFVVNPSMIRPILATLFALFAFASAFLLSVVKYLSAKDFIGLWVFLQQQSTVAGLAQVSAAGILAWRLIVTKIRKARENRLITTSPIALHTTDQVAVPIPTTTGSVVKLVPVSQVDLRAVAREPVTPVAQDPVA